jgi:phenolic acid decarboxylase
LPPQGYDDALDQWILDEPKVWFYEDFIQIGKPITTKSNVLPNSLIDSNESLKWKQQKGKDDTLPTPWGTQMWV